MYRASSSNGSSIQLIVRCRQRRLFRTIKWKEERRRMSLARHPDLDLVVEMKKAGVFAASVAAASSAALAAGDHAANFPFPFPSSSSNEGSGSGTSKKEDTAAGSGSRRGGDDKFAPRFDGLRFIETLVTAHRLVRVLFVGR
ncbi:hypothetical protein MUK42_07029 [Musa troglodytarum]|uniref:Uncharacterized protein n=1 Tax=Musa troglodytarum TaxID=320322 RepID=A0A9E7FNA1_9LILI|nr:hypothetical protein MUK42_07029 [Musa troglodytarum]